MQPLSLWSNLGIFNYQHLLLGELYSRGANFYLAKNVKELSAIDFSHLTLLAKPTVKNLCQQNLLADVQLFQTMLQTQLQNFDLNSYSLVFLIAPDHSALEKKTLLAHAPLLKKVSLIERPYFYNFYLMQKRNFSKVKFMINLFSDCAELSLFEQDQLLVYQKIALHNFIEQSLDFFKTNLKKMALARPDCFYFFTNNSAQQIDSTVLVKALQLEAIEIDKLC